MTRARPWTRDIWLNYTLFPTAPSFLRARPEQVIFRAQTTLASADLSSAAPFTLLSLSFLKAFLLKASTTLGNKSFWDSTDGGSQLDSKADMRPPRLIPSALIRPLLRLDGHLGKICALRWSNSRDIWNSPGRNVLYPPWLGIRRFCDSFLSHDTGGSMTSLAV